ncbi:MAG: YHS domain-containing protein [Bacillota bacterium]|nr:YHS domain-containing protein [Bacillota bacterium]
MAAVRDPVCGMEFEEETALEMGAEVIEHQGRRFYFCSPACRRAFETEPAAYTGGEPRPDPHQGHGA